MFRKDSMDDLKEITISELSNLIKSKKVSIKELVKGYLDRIHKYDKGKLGLNSVLELNPDALKIAEELDNRERNHILNGIPILVKANIDTGDKLHTTAGALALANHIALKDAEGIKYLRDKGAIILGKTNMTEFANYQTIGMPAGYSSLGGQVFSPYDRGGDPSGSSTGSAVSVTANFCMASIGTDTAGSIISPSINNSIVGYRPSIHSLSNQGIIPTSFTLDMIGPMARTVEDIAILYSTMSNTKIDIKKEQELKGVKICLPEGDMVNLSNEESNRIDEILKALTQAGAIIIRMNVTSIETEKIKVIEKYEFKYIMNKYLKTLPKDSQIRTLKDIIDFNNMHKEEALRYGQFYLEDAEENTKGDLSEEVYIKALRDREEKKKIVSEHFKTVDIIINFKNCLHSQYIGLPSITIPYGINCNGIPYGFSLIGLDDQKLLQNAYLVERLVGRRIPPDLDNKE